MVVDDHDGVRGVICRLLRAQPDFTVIGEAVNGAEALSKAQELQPHVIVLDISLPDMDGLTVAAKKIRDVTPSAEILRVSNYNEGEITKAFVAGARRYLLKSNAGLELVAAIRTVNRKEPYLSVKERDQ